jgi:cytochrome c peroxidase
MPVTGFQGGIELINRTSVNQSGSVRTRFSLRKPPSAACVVRRISQRPCRTLTPWIVPLATADRVRVQDTFDLMGRAIAAFEASPEVSPFSSKFDAFLAGNAKLSPTEMRGYALFNGQGRCNRCHVDPEGDPRPLFTDNTTSNLGIPKNPALVYYTQTKPDQYGYVGDPEGQAFVDLGVGGFLRSPENGNDAWRALASKFDGRFRSSSRRTEKTATSRA